MKKVKYLIILMAMIIIPLNVNASTGNLTLKCGDQNSNKIICKLFVSGDTNIKTIDSHVTVDSDIVNVEVEPITGSEYMNSYDADESHLMIIKSMKINSNEELATITLSLKETLSEDLSFKLAIEPSSIGDTNDTEVTTKNGDSKELTFAANTQGNDEPGDNTPDNPDNPSEEPSDNQNENKSDNPKTGILEISGIIVLISLGLGVVIYVKKNQLNY